MSSGGLTRQLADRATASPPLMLLTLNREVPLRSVWLPWQEWTPPGAWTRGRTPSKESWTNQRGTVQRPRRSVCILHSIVGFIRFRASCRCDPLLPAMQWLLFPHIPFCYYWYRDRFLLIIVKKKNIFFFFIVLVISAVLVKCISCTYCFGENTVDVMKCHCCASLAFQNQTMRCVQGSWLCSCAPTYIYFSIHPNNSVLSLTLVLFASLAA